MNFTEEQIQAFTIRIEKLDSALKPKFGKMIVNQMVCHCTDFFRMAIGTKKAEEYGMVDPKIVVELSRSGKTAPTPKGFGQVEGDGTPPTDLENDKAVLKEHILQFAPENWMVTDLESFTKGTPAKTYVAAIEDSEFKVLPKSFFEEKANLDADQLLLQNRKLINNIIAVNNRLMGVLGATAEERYLEFIQLYPNLCPRLSVKLIASYIGITPEYLSEIRGKLTKGE